MLAGAQGARMHGENDYYEVELTNAGLNKKSALDTKQCTDLPIAKPLHYRVLKRLFDIIFSVAVILVGLIPGLLLCVIVAFDTKGTPFYSSTRVGHKGPFKFYKFRSMVSDSDNLSKYLDDEQIQRWHREHKLPHDPRVTRLGHILRVTSVDEFPQFINVLLGQMSIIGPRCVSEEELDNLQDFREVYLSVPGGITGAWQVGARNSATWENGQRLRVELDYIRDASLKMDASIFFNTFGAMFVKRSGQ